MELPAGYEAVDLQDIGKRIRGRMAVYAEVVREADTTWENVHGQQVKITRMLVGRAPRDNVTNIPESLPVGLCE